MDWNIRRRHKCWTQNKCDIKTYTSVFHHRGAIQFGLEIKNRCTCAVSLWCVFLRFVVVSYDLLLCVAPRGHRTAPLLQDHMRTLNLLFYSVCGSIPQLPHTRTSCQAVRRVTQLRVHRCSQTQCVCVGGVWPLTGGPLWAGSGGWSAGAASSRTPGPCPQGGRAEEPPSAGQSPPPWIKPPLPLGEETRRGSPSLWNTGGRGSEEEASDGGAAAAAGDGEDAPQQTTRWRYSVLVS